MDLVDSRLANSYLFFLECALHYFKESSRLNDSSPTLKSNNVTPVPGTSVRTHVPRTRSAEERATGSAPGTRGGGRGGTLRRFRDTLRHQVRQLIVIPAWALRPPRVLPNRLAEFGWAGLGFPEAGPPAPRRHTPPAEYLDKIISHDKSVRSFHTDTGVVRVKCRSIRN